MGKRDSEQGEDRRRTRELLDVARGDRNSPGVLDAIRRLLDRLRGRAREAMRDEDHREEESFEVGESVYLDLIKNPPEFDNTTHASAYVQKAIRNKLTDKARRRHAKKRSPGGAVLSIGNPSDSQSGVVDPAAPPPAPECAEQRAWLRDQLDRLTARDRGLMDGWALGLPAGEYAKIAGLSADAARQRVSRILKELGRNASRDPDMD